MKLLLTRREHSKAELMRCQKRGRIGCTDSDCTHRVNFRSRERLSMRHLGMVWCRAVCVVRNEEVWLCTK